MGDSLTEQPTYPPKLESLLKTPWQVVNKGIGGNTTAMMQARFSSDVLAQDFVKYVVVWGGVNSVRADVSAATIESELQAMYTAAHNKGLKVIAVNIAPFKNFNIAPIWTTTRQTVLDAVNAWIANSAINIDYKIDAYSLLQGTAQTLNATYDGGDHLHLSTAGYNAVANAVFNSIALDYINIS